MPQVTIHLGGRERAGAGHQQGHPVGRPWHRGPGLDRRHPHPGHAAALRALADALVEAADLADDYDADPDAFNQRERAEHDLDLDH